MAGAGGRAARSRILADRAAHPRVHICCPAAWLACGDHAAAAPAASAGHEEGKTIATTASRLRLSIGAPVLLAVAGCAGPQSTLDPAGPAADAIAGIWWAMFWGALAVWLLVMALVTRALYRGRNTRALASPQRLIVGGGLVLPPVLLAGLLVYGSISSARITGLDQEVDARVDVIAGRWRWRFRYYDDAGEVVAESLDVLSLPRGRMVEFHVTSADVIHSFWIPRLGGKMDAIPGRVNRLRLRADGAGRIRGQCAEYCGTGHSVMAFEVLVHDDAGHAEWLARQAAAGFPEAAFAADAKALEALAEVEPGHAIRVDAAEPAPANDAAGTTP